MREQELESSLAKQREVGIPAGLLTATSVLDIGDSS